MPSKRVTPPQRRKPPSRLVPSSSASTIEERAKSLADSLEHDPFDAIGFAAISASSMQGELETFIDRLAAVDPRLGSAIRAIIASLPFVDNLVKPELIVDEVLPTWLLALDHAQVTKVLRRSKSRRRCNYLVEITLVGDLVATAAIDVQLGLEDQITGSWTVAAPADNVASLYENKYRLKGDQTYQEVGLVDGGQLLLVALDGSLHSTSMPKDARPPWPATLPQIAWVINLALGEVSIDDHPYLALRQGASGRTTQARKLRRSLSGNS